MVYNRRRRSLDEPRQGPSPGVESARATHPEEAIGTAADLEAVLGFAKPWRVPAGEEAVPDQEPGQEPLTCAPCGNLAGKRPGCWVADEGPAPDRPPGS